LASTIPAPYSALVPAGFAVSSMRFTTCCPRRPSDTSSAATPATCGVAIDVPANSSYARSAG